MKEFTKKHILFWVVTVVTFFLVYFVSGLVFDAIGVYGFPFAAILFYAGTKLSSEFAI